MVKINPDTRQAEVAQIVQAVPEQPQKDDAILSDVPDHQQGKTIRGERPALNNEAALEVVVPETSVASHVTEVLPLAGTRLPVPDPMATREYADVAPVFRDESLLVDSAVQEEGSIVDLPEVLEIHNQILAAQESLILTEQGFIRLEEVEPSIMPEVAEPLLTAGAADELTDESERSDLLDFPEALRIHEQVIRAFADEVEAVQAQYIPADIQPALHTDETVIDQLFDWESVLFPVNEGQDHEDMGYNKIDMIELLENLSEEIPALKPEVIESVAEPLEEVFRVALEAHLQADEDELDASWNLQEATLAQLTQFFDQEGVALSEEEAATLTGALLAYQTGGRPSKEPLMAEDENAESTLAEVVTVIEQVQDGLLGIKAEVIELAAKPVEEALQRAIDLPPEAAGRPEEELADVLAEFFAETGLEITEEQIGKLVHYLMQPEVLEGLRENNLGFIELFDKGTYERQYNGAKAFKKSKTPLHTLLGKVMLLLTGQTQQGVKNPLQIFSSDSDHFSHAIGLPHLSNQKTAGSHPKDGLGKEKRFGVGSKQEPLAA
ncbi:MAG TPA: hypothetical protein VK674_04815 [Candidatus Limnocylindria bacterium]|nr:hypothetical protein [Candidatus Limnocylindria bacterium]